MLWAFVGCAESFQEDSEPLDYIEVFGTTGDGQATGFVYGDSMLLNPSLNEHHYSTDLVKVSASLASAGYQESCVNPMLISMGYNYTNLNFTRRNLYDNDHVALTVGWKNLTEKNATLWCVVVRGSKKMLNGSATLILGKRGKWRRSSRVSVGCRGSIGFIGSISNVERIRAKHFPFYRS